MLGRLTPVLAGLIAGVGARAGSGYLGAFATPASFGAVGYFMHNDTLMTLAGVNLSQMVPVPGAATSGGGGY